jgi:predicted GNAT family acetyltransferase
MKTETNILPKIKHDLQNHIFTLETGGLTAHLSYEICNNGLDVRHTFVPEELRGRNIASRLVKAAYDYAVENGLRPIATCSYAVIWLQRHPEYGGKTGKDYGGKGTCAI